MTDQLIEPLSAEEKNYAEASSRLTLLDCDIEEAKKMLDRFTYEHPLRTSDVVAHGVQLEGRLDELYAQRQRLLKVWSDLKMRLNG